MESLKYYLPGGVLIFIAIMIAIFPEIIVAFISAMGIVAGITALTIGHAIRKSETVMGWSDAWFHDNPFLGGRFVQRPVFRSWYRRP